MRTDIKHFVLAVFLVGYVFLPAQIAGADAKADVPEKKVADGNSAVKKNESPWVNVKKDVKPIRPNIPVEYNDLVNTFKSFWEALKAKDFKTAYSLESSEYREGTSLDLYQYKRKKTAEIISVLPLEVRKTNEKEVIVKAGLSYKLGPGDTLTLINDRWTREKDGWRHVPQGE